MNAIVKNDENIIPMDQEEDVKIDISKIDKKIIELNNLIQNEK